MEQKMENYGNEIVELPKEVWKGVTIPLVTRSDSYYDLEIRPLDSSGCVVSLTRKQAEEEIVHTPEEYDFPDSLSARTEICWPASRYVRRNGQTGLWLQNCGCPMSFAIRESGRG